MDETVGATTLNLTTGRTTFHYTFIVSSERHWSTFLYFFTPHFYRVAAEPSS
jgi:hypothetical protein